MRKPKSLTAFDMIAFDADDTLWHTESIFSEAQEKYKRLLEHYQPEGIDKRLYEAELENLQHFGYGVKGFTLSMIETAIQLTEGRVKGSEIQEIINFAKKMLQTPIELLPDVEWVIHKLAQTIPLMIITKGDLLDQETKIARSGLADSFQYIEIISKKDAKSYSNILNKIGVAPEKFLMIGNSVPSDILPVIEIGGNAIHIPYHLTWAHEIIDSSSSEIPPFLTLEKMGELPHFLNIH